MEGEGEGNGSEERSTCSCDFIGINDTTKFNSCTSHIISEPWCFLQLRSCSFKIYSVQTPTAKSVSLVIITLAPVTNALSKSSIVQMKHCQCLKQLFSDNSLLNDGKFMFSLQACLLSLRSQAWITPHFSPAVQVASLGQCFLPVKLSFLSYSKLKLNQDFLFWLNRVFLRVSYMLNLHHYCSLTSEHSRKDRFHPASPGTRVACYRPRSVAR